MAKSPCMPWHEEFGPWCRYLTSSPTNHYSRLYEFANQSACFAADRASLTTPHFSSTSAMASGKRPKLNPSGGAKPKELTRDTAMYEFRQRVLKYFATHSIKETLAKMYPGLDPAARETKRKSIYYSRKMSAKVERACISSKTSCMKIGTT
ncbi:unnamed protein product [Phytophthora fragariaefolia]|uniref:Unnamed protein product n=1 Tax=Phytophthora fragariaefolia TaxID=1490495 RepID=A0A9W6XWW5_9STRA|nr:unnamed protein product [Phytophthora fragariaefolia]